MRSFHISDVLSVTTERLVSSRHMDGVYELLNFLTGDDVLTHDVPGAMKECEPCLRSQFPALFPDSAVMKACLKDLDKSLKADGDDKAARAKTITAWVQSVRLKMNLPEMLPVYEMGVEKRHSH
jgi:hypothetical protein